MARNAVKRVKYANKRLEVIRSAARVFAKLGYHAASITDIAAELGTTPAALYYYVKSKEELLFEAGQIAVEEMSEAMRAIEADDSLSALDKLRRFLRYHAAYICDDFGRCFVLTRSNDLSSHYRDTMLEQARQITTEVRRLIRTGIAEGSIRACDDMLITNALFGAVNTMARWWSPDERLSVNEAFDAIFDAFAEGLDPRSGTPAANEAAQSGRTTNAG